MASEVNGGDGMNDGVDGNGADGGVPSPNDTTNAADSGAAAAPVPQQQPANDGGSGTPPAPTDDLTELLGTKSVDGQPKAANDAAKSASDAGNPPKRPSTANRPEDAPDEVFRVPTLKHFSSSTRIPQTLEACVERALSQGRRLDHTLIHGKLGTGTALLARAMIADYAPRRMIELDALNGVNVPLLRRSVERLGERGVLFIRHIEVLDGSCDQFLAACISRGELPSENRPPRVAGTERGPANDFERMFGGTPTPASAASIRRLPNFTIVATAHITNRVGYQLRTRFEQMMHLRPDPRGMRRAVERVLASAGVTFDVEACPQVERVLGSLCDGSEQLVKSMLTRAEIEGVKHLDLETTISVLEDDLSSRLPDEVYGASLRDYLVGRDLLGGRDAAHATPDAVERISRETGWGEVAVRGALAAISKDERARAQQAAA